MKKLIDFHLPLRKQDESFNCGHFATSFAIEAKSNMRELDNTEILTDQLTDMWEEKYGENQGFILPLLNSLRFFQDKPLTHESGNEVEIYNIMPASNLSFKSICLLVDNMVTPILAIEFKGRRMRDDYMEYTNRGSSRSRKHIVSVVGHTDDYLILKDSAGSKKRPNGSYNRIYKENINIIKECAYFNVKKYKPQIIYPFLENKSVTQEFGANPSNYTSYGLKGHEGVDFACSEGTQLLASIDGEVRIKNQGVYGHHIYIKNNKYEILYAHCSSMLVRNGDKIKQGTPIALSGNTGRSSGAHLHYGIREMEGSGYKNHANGYFGYINPRDYLTF